MNETAKRILLILMGQATKSGYAEYNEDHLGSLLSLPPQEPQHLLEQLTNAGAVQVVRGHVGRNGKQLLRIL